jgi:hypothetical protein
MSVGRGDMAGHGASGVPFLGAEVVGISVQQSLVWGL